MGYNRLIIGLTGDALQDDIERFAAAGADAVFAKPFREDQLSGILSLIAKRGVKSSPASQADLQEIAARRPKV